MLAPKRGNFRVFNLSIVPAPKEGSLEAFLQGLKGPYCSWWPLDQLAFLPLSAIWAKNMSTLPPGHQSPSYWMSLLTLSLTLMSFMAELLLWPRVRQSKAEICVLLFGPRMPTHRPTSRQQGLKSTESWTWKKRGRNAHRRRNHRVEKLGQSWHRTNLHVYRLRYNRFRKWLTLLLSLFFLCMRQTLQKEK